MFKIDVIRRMLLYLTNIRKILKCSPSSHTLAADSDLQLAQQLKSAITMALIFRSVVAQF